MSDNHSNASVSQYGQVPTPVATIGQPTPVPQGEHALPSTGYTVIAVALLGAILLAAGITLFKPRRR
jgi:LPXTG-motif cell wall-anchored protein